MNQNIKKKIFIRTFGCQMNEYDSELVKSILTGNGFVLTEEEGDADIVLLNTCSVRENAHRKVFGKIHSIHHEHAQKPVIIGVLGCMATGLKEKLIENSKLKIDFVVGPDSYKRLPDIINECRRRHKTQVTSHKQKISDFALNEFEMYSDIYPIREAGINAWIAVMRGCNNFCSFCIVPYVRGRERSRSVDSVLEETKKLVQEGFQQVTLLGQNVNSYKSDDADFSTLIEKVSQVEGIKRIRFMSPHPKDFPDRLLDVMAANPKICKHIHLPLQAGNARVLKLMNRHYSKEDFLKLVDKIRTKLPAVALTTDIIIGFPTETDKEFADTVDVVKMVRFDSAFIFKYSVRKGTLAEKKYADDVPEDTKTKHIVALNKIQKQISLEKNQEDIGRELEVLIERESLTESDQMVHGRSDGNKIVILARSPETQHPRSPEKNQKSLGPRSPGALGTFLNVKITGATPHVLKGKVESNE